MVLIYIYGYPYVQVKTAGEHQTSLRKDVHPLQYWCKCTRMVHKPVELLNTIDISRYHHHNLQKVIVNRSSQPITLKNPLNKPYISMVSHQANIHKPYMFLRILHDPPGPAAQRFARHFGGLRSSNSGIGSRQKSAVPRPTPGRHRMPQRSYRYTLHFKRNRVGREFGSLKSLDIKQQLWSDWLIFTCSFIIKPADE